jgi:GntR family transcriptional regulator
MGNHPFALVVRMYVQLNPVPVDAPDTRHESARMRGKWMNSSVLTEPTARGPRPPSRSHPLPLWAQVSDDLRRRIGTGEFDGGFAGEHDLTEQYGVSRHTIREALRVLRVEGLLKSERGRGTTVQETRYSQNLGTLYSLFTTISDQGVEQTSTVKRLTLTVNPTVAAELNVAPTSEFVVIERVRFAGGEPLAYDTAWLLAEVARPLLDADFTHSSIYGELRDRCGIEMDSGGERIYAQVASHHIATQLNLSSGSPVFAIERIGAKGTRVIEWRETFIRGDRFTLEFDFSHTPNTSRARYNKGAA